MSRSKLLAAFALVALCVTGIALNGALSQKVPERWAAAGPMVNARSDACAVVLSDGRILAAGGASEEGVLASAEFLRAPGESPAPPPMAYARAKHSCVLLPDGKVLVADGRTTGGGAINAAEVYDPVANTCTTIQT